MSQQETIQNKNGESDLHFYTPPENELPKTAFECMQDDIDECKREIAKLSSICHTFMNQHSTGK